MGFFGNLFSSGFDDPKPMTNEYLLSAIAGQADWLDKMIRSPLESQKTPSIVELTKKRKTYLASLCKEVTSRNQPVFFEVIDYAKKLEDSGVSLENSALRSVKEKLFSINGVNYLADWEF